MAVSAWTAPACSFSLLAFLTLSGCWPETGKPETDNVKFEGAEVVSGGLAVSRPMGFEVVRTWENGVELVESDARDPLTIRVGLVRALATDVEQPQTTVKQVAEAVGSGGAEYSFSSGKVVGSCLIYIGGHQQSEGTPSFLVAQAVLENARATEASGC